jgi:hypothetical protein
MTDLSIETLMQKKNIISTNKPGILNVYSLANIKNDYEEINTDILINTRIEKREKILNVYMKYFNNCYDKIKILNAGNKIDLIYEVPRVVPDCAGFRPIDCIQFIETKLRSSGMDACKLSQTKLFITWKYIEANLNTNKL